MWLTDDCLGILQVHLEYCLRIGYTHFSRWTHGEHEATKFIHFKNSISFVFLILRIFDSRYSLSWDCSRAAKYYVFPCLNHRLWMVPWVIEVRPAHKDLGKENTWPFFLRFDPETGVSHQKSTISKGNLYTIFILFCETWSLQAWPLVLSTIP